MVDKKITKRNQSYISWTLQLLILLYAVLSFYEEDHFWAIAGLFGFILSLTPMIICKKFHATLPWELNLLIALALFLHIGGNIRGWYEILPWWDKVAHFVSSAVVAILGFILAVVLDQYTEAIKMNHQMIIFFVLIFTMGLGALWEIGEFLCDSILGTQMQLGLEDTVWDLIFDLIGGGIIAIFGNFYLKRVPKERFIKEFWVKPGEGEVK
jgi:uncharacterized membrane protein YjdF